MADGYGHAQKTGGNPMAAVKVVGICCRCGAGLDRRKIWHLPPARHQDLQLSTVSGRNTHQVATWVVFSTGHSRTQEPGSSWQLTHWAEPLVLGLVNFYVTFTTQRVLKK